MVLPPLILATPVPFLVAFGTAGLLRRRPVMGAIAIPLGSLAGFVLLEGGVPVLQSVPHHRTGEIMLGAVLAVAILSVFGERAARWRIIPVWAALAVVCWSFGPEGLAALDTADLLRAGVFAVFGIAVLLRLPRMALDSGAPVAQVAVAALALTVVGLAAHAGVTPWLAAATGGACLGWLLWIRRIRDSRSAIAALAAGACLLAAAVESARTSLYPPWAMLPLILCFWPEPIAARLRGLGKSWRRKAMQPWLQILAAVPPAIAAMIWAMTAALLR
jgi:hypothetical protein